MDFDLNDFYITVGKKRSGKSHFIKQQIIPSVLKSGKRLIIIDFVTREYSYLGLETITSVKELMARGIDFISNNSFRVCLQNWNDEEELKALLGLIYLAGNSFVIVEEAGLVLNTRQFEIATVISFSGRHVNTGAMFVTQRPRKLPADIISQSVNWIIFKIIDNYDLIEIKKKFKDFAVSQINNLSQYEFIIYLYEEFQGVFKI